MDAATRLTKLGLSDPALVGLLLPTGYADLTAHPISAWTEGAKAVVELTATAKPLRKDGRPPRTLARGQDPEGQEVTVVAFGNTHDLQKAWIPGKSVPVRGTVKVWQGRWQFQNPEILPPVWLGRVRPVYPSKKGVLSEPKVRELVHIGLQGVAARAASWLRRRLEDAGEPWDEPALVRQAGGGADSLAELFVQAHSPASVPEGEVALSALDRIAARLRIAEIRQGRPGAQAAANRAVPGAVWRELLAATGMTPTASQQAALRAIHEDLADPAPMRRILAGDVGSGKTLFYGLAAAAVARTGGAAAILVPSQVLADQIARELRSWWSDLDVAIVTGEGVDGKADAPVVVGTQALLHKLGTERSWDLIVVDEQQRFSPDQRESLLGASTNHLEVSATPIPRSAGLLALGGLEVSKLEPWTTKTITTHLARRDDPAERRSVFEALSETVQSGYQAAVIYPRVSEGDGTSRDGAVEMATYWEKHFPGQVALIHGRTSDAEKRAALDALRCGERRLLVATTVIEVGVDLPALYHVVVLQAEALGLAQLHQIRGRAARQGGAGRMDLVTSRGDDAKAMARLRVLTRTQDGARVAWEDAKIRGFGPLVGAEQKGATDSPMPGRAIEPRVAEEAASWPFQPRASGQKGAVS